jgi:signal peptidase I
VSARVGNVFSAAAFALLFLVCLAFVAIRVAGFSTYVVTGGSMEPNIAKGALVLVEPVTAATIEVGDVITFQQYEQTTTHRVITISESARGLSFKTKGDANVAADPEDKTFTGSVGVVRVTIPLLGYLIATAQAYWRLLLTLLAAAIFFSCAGVLFFTNGSKALTLPKRQVRGPVAVVVDPEDAWRAHLAWLERSRMRAAGLERAA